MYPSNIPAGNNQQALTFSIFTATCQRLLPLCPMPNTYSGEQINAAINRIAAFLNTAGIQIAYDFVEYELPRYNWDNKIIDNIVKSVVEYCMYDEGVRLGIKMTGMDQSVNYIVENAQAVHNYKLAMQQPQQTILPALQYYAQQSVLPAASNYNQNRPSSLSFGGTPVVAPTSTTIPRSPLEAVGDNMNISAHLPNPVTNALIVDRQETPPVVSATATKPETQTVVIRYELKDQRIKCDEVDEQILLVNMGNNRMTTQFATFIAAARGNYPVIDNLYMDRYVPLSDLIDDDFCMELKALHEVEDINSFHMLIMSMKENRFNYDFLNWLGTEIGTFIVTTLRYKYGIVKHSGFPYLTEYEEAAKKLTEYGILHDMERAILGYIKGLFINFAIIPTSVDGNANVVNINILQMTIKSDVVILPWVTQYNPIDESLLSSTTGIDIISINDVFKQVFNKIDDMVVTFDVYDKVLNRYRVYRCGSTALTPSSFKVELLK